MAILRAILNTIKEDISSQAELTYCSAIDEKTDNAFAFVIDRIKLNTIESESKRKYLISYYANCSIIVNTKLDKTSELTENMTDYLITLSELILDILNSNQLQNFEYEDSEGNSYKVNYSVEEAESNIGAIINNAENANLIITFDINYNRKDK